MAKQINIGTTSNKINTIFSGIKADGIANIGLDYITTTPTEDNLSGVRIALLESLPETRYKGWLYFILDTDKYEAPTVINGDLVLEYVYKANLSNGDLEVE